MDVTSLGWRTDLALLDLGGSSIDDRGDHLVVRTPHNPTFWWGNFLLLAAPPANEDEARRWVELHREIFADLGVDHVSIGVDGAAPVASDPAKPLAPLRAVGLEPDVSTVLTATSVHRPPGRDAPVGGVVCRALISDDEWAQQVDLSTSVHAGVVDDAHRLFERRRVETTQGLVEAGHGRWFGAFEGGRLLSSLGLFRAGDGPEGGLARFQNVATRVEARGRGLAGQLVHYAGSYGLADPSSPGGGLGAHTLVIVADPGYPAIRIYRSVGFVDTQVQLAAALTR